MHRGGDPISGFPSLYPFSNQGNWVFWETVELLGTTCPSKLVKIQHNESSPKKSHNCHLPVP